MVVLLVRVYKYEDQEKLGNHLKYNTFCLEYRPQFKPKPIDAAFWLWQTEQDTFC